jgi:uncharacterized cysteine cluster protein YcgN (CxxCxxCC family)
MPRSVSQNETMPAIEPTLDGSSAPLVEKPFWQTKTLEAMNPVEWESLCDRCGKCCLVKLEDEDSGEIFVTDIACKLFDAGACACSNYPARRKKVRDCIKLTPMSVRAIGWLPKTCGYRLVAEGRPLEAWHPLISGSPETVHEAGISVRGRTNGSEKTVKLEDYPLHIVDWEG